MRGVSRRRAQLALSYIEYPNPPGKVNLEADVLADSVVHVIRECVDALPDRGEVAAIAVSSFGESFVPVDEAGRALTDVIMYFADSSSGEFDELVARVGAEKFMRSRASGRTPRIRWQRCSIR